MAFTITAELPLGTYRGASADGRRERIPSVARLYSALLCAAGFGPRAAQRSDDLMGPCEADEIALRWLEDNPPDAVSVPALEVNGGGAVAYRDDGTIKQAKGAISMKKLRKDADVSVAVDGPFSWTWYEPPPPAVVAALEALCPDVPCLGTTESPARLTTSRDAGNAATHVLDRDAGLFSAGSGEDVEVPLAGRLAELGAAHQAVTHAIPPAAKDRYKTDEASRAAVPPRRAVALVRYTPAAAPPSDVPWPQVLLLPLGRRVDEPDRVRLAVVAHRALISAIGEGAPPLVTGVYPDQRGTSRPANRLAIQVLNEDMPVDLAGAPAALALLVPRAAEATDLDALAAGVAALRVVRGAGGRRYEVTDSPRAMQGAEFWRARPPGTLRLWRTAPPAVPDTRGVKDGPWTFAHAAMLSLGFVWRDQLPELRGRGDVRQRAIVDVVNDAGVVVVRAAALRESDVRPYVHKVNPHAVIRPYRAELWLGDLCSERTIQALGQTRHLGGGLLVPADLPEQGGNR